MTDFEPNQFENQRTDKRTTTVYRPVLIDAEEIAGFCLLRNISSEGMMGRFYTELVVGTLVNVQFSAFLSARGKVSWSKGGMIGLQFSTPVDVPSILLGLSSGPLKGRSNRAPRLQIEANIQIVLDGRTVPVDVQDISQKGLKIRTSFLRTAEEVTVLLDGLEPKKAVVRWTQPNLAGLNFIQPLAFDQLGEWVIRHHEKTARVSARSRGGATELGQIR